LVLIGDAPVEGAASTANVPAAGWSFLGAATDLDDAGVAAAWRFPAVLPGTDFIFAGAVITVAAVAGIGVPAITLVVRIRAVPRVMVRKTARGLIVVFIFRSLTITTFVLGDQGETGESR
jgi:hypothetical protein